LKRCGKNFKNFHRVDCKILAFEVTKLGFFGLAKKKLHFTRSHLYEKRSKMVVILWVFLFDKLASRLKIFTSFEIVQHIYEKTNK